MVQIRAKDLFASEITSGVKLFMGGRDTYDYEKLTSEEEDAVRLVFDKGVKRIENVSPKLAATIRPQREAFVKWAGIAKATFPETRSVQYPAIAGGIGVDWITPEAFTYRTTPSSSYPCYTSYVSTASATNTFDLSLSAGTASYIAGTGTASQMYKGCKTQDKHSFIVIAQDGFVGMPQLGDVSIGASANGLRPAFNLMTFRTEVDDKYSPIAMAPTICETIEENKVLYQYTTPGMIPMDHNVGTEIAVIPNATAASSSKHTIIPVGLVFYEYDFLTRSNIPRSGSTP